jgi:hypothetical protein
MSESELAYHVKDFQKQLERFEKSAAEGAAKVEKLRDRVQTLETTKNILIALALIFGVSGGFGWYLLQSAQTKLSEVSIQIEKLQNGTKVIFDAEQQAVADARREIAAEKASQLRSFAVESASLTPHLQEQIRVLQKWTGYIFHDARITMQVGEKQAADLKKKGFSDTQREVVALWSLLDALAGADKPFVDEVHPQRIGRSLGYEPRP